LGEVYSKVIRGRSWRDWGGLFKGYWGQKLAGLGEVYSKVIGAEAAEVGEIGGGLFKGYWGQK